MYDDDYKKDVIGKKVSGVIIGKGRFLDRVEVVFDDGKVLTVRLDGGCCSQSYFTDPSQFQELVGSTIQDVEERDGSPDGNSPADKAKYPGCDDGNDSISWHFLVFTTSKGHVTIDWRNDSNGYYDGNCHMTVA